MLFPCPRRTCQGLLSYILCICKSKKIKTKFSNGRTKMDRISTYPSMLRLLEVKITTIDSEPTTGSQKTSNAVKLSAAVSGLAGA